MEYVLDIEIVRYKPFCFCATQFTSWHDVGNITKINTF